MSNKLPKELQARIKSVRIVLVVMGLCGAITIIGIPWAIVFFVHARILRSSKLPSKNLLVFTGIISLPLCILLVPIVLEVGLWRLVHDVNAYKSTGNKAFQADKAWLKLPMWRSYGLVTALSAALALTVLFIMPVPYTTTRPINIPFTIQYIQDNSLELGDTQTRQTGINGQGIERHRQLKPLVGYLLGITGYYTTTDLPVQTTIAPTSQVVAKGTKKYQYMWCSDGSYRYYTNDQFKDPNAGFTHKSTDFCSQNKQGHMTGIADTAPPQQTIRTIYQPSYTRLYPTHTTCHDYSFLNEISCTSY